MKHLSQKIIPVAATLLLCVGCSTTKRSTAGTPHLPPLSNTPPASALVSDEPALRKEYLDAIRQATAEYEQATNALSQAQQAEKVIHVTEQALQLGGWKPRERMQIQNQRVAMLKARDFALAKDSSDQARPYIQDRQDYDKAIQSLDEMMRLCQRCSEATYWNQTEKRQWLEQSKLLQELRAKFVVEFTEATAAVKAALLQAQKQFVNSQAAEDLRAARALFDGQDSKWFNWTIFGHFRDDVREFAKAVQLCDRVVSDSRIDAAINVAAAAQRAQSAGRLDGQGREIYNACSQLASYAQCPGYPSLTPEELHHQSELLWRATVAPPAPPLDGCGETSTRHVLAKISTTDR